MPPVVDEREARQGPKGRPVFYVLVATMILAGLYLAAMTIWAGSESQTSVTQEAARESVDPGTTSSTTREISPANPAYPAPADRAANPQGAAPGGSTGGAASRSQ